MINGQAHGPDKETTTCQLHMRRFRDGDTIVIEPWRAKAFPVLRDLVVDRSPLDRIMSKGGFVSVNTGNAQDANCLPVPKRDQEKAMDAAACIGCGACVAACKNASASLFVSAKVSQLAMLPQGKVERRERVINMVERDGLFTHLDQPLVQDVEHLQKGHVLGDVRQVVGAEFAPGIGTRLPPHLQREIHSRTAHYL